MNAPRDTAGGYPRGSSSTGKPSPETGAPMKDVPPQRAGVALSLSGVVVALLVAAAAMALWGRVQPPAMILVLGAVLAAVSPRRVRPTLTVLLPAAALWYVWGMADGTMVHWSFAGMDLTVVRADRLSLIFGKIFSLVGLLAAIFAWHIDDRRQQVAALLYNAGSLGVTFAGDYFTLYAFWELMAVASVILIWARDRKDSQAAGKRYILVHLTGGAVLLAGILLHLHGTGSIAFDRITPGEGGIAAWLILFSFCLNAAVPPLGSWLVDAYPRATITGAVFCSALTSKTAVYTLLRGYPGWEILIVFGVVMAVYSVVYAVLANDIRRILSYSIISQVGYMVAGVGIGTTLAINGATAHAVSHILYKSLLFMGAGAVIYATGHEKLTQLGGFWRRQKWVFGLYIVGALSISGVPLWNGFISKSMVIAAAGEEHLNWVYLLLMVASVGSFLHTGLRLPYYTWMGEDKGIKPKPVPKNMIVAMVLGALFCTVTGVAPSTLYRYLPYAVHWNPWTVHHFVETVQVLLFAFFAFWVMRPMLAPREVILVDVDVLYRKTAPLWRWIFVDAVGAVFDASDLAMQKMAHAVVESMRDPMRFVPGYPQRVHTDEPDYDEDRSRPPLMLPLSLALALLVLLWLVAKLLG